MRGNFLNFEHTEYTPYGEMWVEDQTTEDLDKIPYRFTSKEWDEETELYYMSARYQDPMTSRWISADPAGAKLVNPNGKSFVFIGSINWYSYCDNNPVIYDDPTGHAPRNLSDSQRTAYKNNIASYSSYNADTNNMGMPSSYDCADVGTYLYDGAMQAATGQANSYTDLQHGDQNLSSISSIHSSDFFGNNENNISMYGETSFNSPSVEVGSVGVFQAPEGASWTGHVVTVTGVARDDEGKVTSISIIHGHMSKDTNTATITSQADLDSYQGTFLGWGELGKDSATVSPDPEPVTPTNGSGDMTKE